MDASYYRDHLIFMEPIKINQTSLFNPTSTKILNTDFLDEKTAQNDKALGKGQNLLDPLASQSIADTTVMPTNRLFSKPILITQDTWSTSEGIRFLYLDSIGNILNTVNSPANNLLQIHSFFRSGFKFTLRINSSPFHSGKLALVFKPPRDSITDASRIVISGYPIAYADAGNSSVVTLEVPFVTVRDFVSTAGNEEDADFGSIGIYVFNKLDIGAGGPTNVAYTLWLEPCQTELAIPRCSHTVSLQSEDVAMGMASLSIPDLPDLLSDVQGVLGVLGQGSLKGAPSVPSIKSLVSGHKQVTDSKTMNAAYAGSAPSISNMNGHRTEHLSLVPEEMRIADPFTMEGRDVDSVAKIAQVPMLVRTVSWGPESIRLMILPVTPSLSDYLAPTATASGYREYTYASYVAQPFEFWRGSMNYRITIAGTQQHTGRILASWIPGDSIANNDSALFPNPSLSQLALFPSVVFDLSENREFNISIPYEASTPFKRVRKADYGTDVGSEGINGILLLTVMNALRGPGTVAGTIDVNVFVSAGSDIQFKGLRTERNSIASVPYLEESSSLRSKAITGKRKKTVKISKIKLQSMDVALESSRMGMEMDKANSVALDVTTVSPDYDQGESDVSVTKLLSRYYPQCGFRFNVAGQSNKVFRVVQHPGLLFQQNPNDPSITTLEFTNLLNHFRNIFAFWSGSLNYFFLHNTTVNNPVLATFTHKAGVPTVASTNYPGSDLSTGAQVFGAFADDAIDLSVSSRYSHISNLRINSAVEITLPYRSIFRRSFVSNSADYQAASCAPGTLEIIYSNPSATDQLVSLQLFQSVGDDFRYHYLVPPRRHVLKPTG